MYNKELSIEEMLNLPNGTKVVLETDDYGERSGRTKVITTKQGTNLDVGKAHYWIDNGLWKIFHRKAYLYEAEIE